MEQEPCEVKVVSGKRVGTRIFHLCGPLTLQSFFPLQEELRRDPPPLTVFDLSAVPYMDSAGMGAIINAYVSAKRRGKSVVAVGANYRVVELFKLTHVDTLIPIYATVDEAEVM